MMETVQNEATRAAQYVRMSTEHQQYSTYNQREKILEYAAQNHIDIVRTFSDDGKSGLSIGGRPGLRELISCIEEGKADFSLILVYDVSRWGRFQDADESAYWEYRIKQHGIRINYIAEQFENDGSPVSTIVKGVKRAMAGEYSRELSAKTFTGLCNIVRRGFSPGGLPGFGYRRQLLDIAGNPKGILASGEHKSIQTDRVVFVAGPDYEIELLRLIFHWFADELLSIPAIVKRFNQHPLAISHDLHTNPRTVSEYLRNERYIGRLVYNKKSEKLHGRLVHNSPDLWVTKENAFEGIVPSELFWRAQKRLEARSKKISTPLLIDKLRQLAISHGADLGNLEYLDNDLPSRDVIIKRLGGVNAIKAKLGITLGPVSFSGLRRIILNLSYAEVIKQVTTRFTEEEIQVEFKAKQNILVLDGETRIRVHLLFQQDIELALRRRYQGELPGREHSADIMLWIVINQNSHSIEQYYLIPMLDMGINQFRVELRHLERFNPFLFQDLGVLCQRLRKVRISSVSITQDIGKQTGDMPCQ